MKFLLIISFLLVSIYGFSQADVIPPLKAKDSFELQTNPVFKKDSLVIIPRETKLDSSSFIVNNKIDKKLLNRYKISVFYYSNAKSRYPYYVKQWNAPIVIYMDKALPKQLRKSVKLFISNFEGIDNLNITITKNKNKANYYIKPTDKIFINKSYIFENYYEEERFAFNNGDYVILPSENQQIQGCILELNLNTHLSIDILESNLKQLFFLSLGRFFVIHNDRDVTSYLSPFYEPQNNLSMSDLTMLKIHYSHIYEFPTTSTEFNNLLKANQ
ncbi:hypothetical protein [uncultured Psychroserpens sp.]|uniref:hypothetical protein n=1 Tax=uncultured Psychroserpens sp. TaxID=255436 RepID=UPI002636C4C5|nr:hypothetical protein [uncultured Psychroserpens sp.]